MSRHRRALILIFVLVLGLGLPSLVHAKENCADPGLITAVDAKLQEDFDATFFLDPEVVDSTDSRELARRIVRRLHDICDVARDPSGVAPNDDSSEIVMLVPDRYLASVAANGFKNQHQTSVTGGSNAKAERLRAEDGHVLLTVPYTNQSRELLPKYALQVFKGKGMGEFGLPTNYGNVLFRFKPAVKERATWSYEDSLGVSDPLRTNRLRPGKDGTCRYGYCEAQIWGRLDVSDVKSLSIPKGMAVTDAMKAFGVPIYEYGPCVKDAKDKCVATPGSEGTSISAEDTEPITPVYVPPKGATPPPKPVETVDSLAAAAAAEANPVAKALINSRRLQISTTDQLIKEYQTPAAATSTGGWSAENNALGNPTIRVLAELAGRPKTPQLNQLFLDAYKKGTNTTEKAVALMGLSKLDPKQLKPLLLESLGADGLQGKVAIAIALQLRTDPEIRAALMANPYAKSILEKVESKKLCEAEVHA